MYRTLQEVRDAYEKNYRELCETIQKMGGETLIEYHRRNRTALYFKLRRLQKVEHYLDDLENIYLNGNRPTYFDSPTHRTAS